MSLTPAPKRSAVARGDLLRCLAASGADALASQAALCGYEAREESDVPPAIGKSLIDSIAELDTSRTREKARKAQDEEPRQDMRFWIAASLEVESEKEVNRRHEMPPEFEAAEPFPPGFFEWPGRPLAGQPLLAWSKVWPFLRMALGREINSRRPDLRIVLNHIVRGKPLRRMPRLKRRGWNPQAMVVCDRRIPMQSFWDDYADLLKRLERIRGTAGLTTETLRGDGEEELRKKIRPQPGTSVLVLGDLGQFGGESPQAKLWLSIGRVLRRGRIAPWALCPCPPDRWKARMAKVWKIAYWDRGHRLPQSPRGQAARPLPEEEAENRRREQLNLARTLVSPAIRVERGLLRDLRLQCPSSELDAGVEYDLWESKWTYGNISAFSLLPEPLKGGREGLSRMNDDQLLQAVVSVLRRHHEYASHVFGAAELIGLKDCLSHRQWRMLLDRGVIGEKDLEDAHLFLRRLTVTLLQEAAHRTTRRARDLAAFADRDIERLQHEALNLVELQSLWALARKIQEDGKQASWIQKENIDWIDQLGEEGRYQIEVDGRGLIVERFAAPEQGRFPLSFPRSRAAAFWGYEFDSAREITGVRRIMPVHERLLVKRGAAAPVQVTVISDRECHHLRSIPRPGWAKRMGYDRFGLYAELEIEGVKLRLRWIPPGSFRMGDEDDGPPHEVTITEGFWMAETQTTQALWEAVVAKQRLWRRKIKKAPSRFKSEQRPVESVSWEDSTTFCELLNELKLGLEFGLPVEAQWEYACRAGTESRFNNGRDNEEALNELGWHDGNAGGETHEVGQKEPNHWGLYDMHGNVWEWCMDGPRDYLEELERDPVGSLQESAKRVIRGGSWDFSAEYCRSAFRVAVGPGDRSRGLGFRLVAGRVSASRSGAIGLWAEGADAPWPWDRASADSPESWAPQWADRAYEDEVGRVAEVGIEGARFRFRWVPPGEFVMGSPREEDGRFDDEGPPHEVELTKGYWMGETPVTQEQWKAVVGENPSSFEGASRPVETVSWEDCRRYTKKLSEATAGLNAALPTEAQWEYACRAGTESRFNNGKDSEEALDELGWYDANAGDETHEVGQKEPNRWGLYDMHGNVFEWCLDGMRRYTGDAAADPVGTLEGGARRVFRGGSWLDSARYCRSAFRYALGPGYRYHYLGFRLVAGQEPEAP